MEVSAQEAGVQDWDWPPAPGGPGHSEPQLVPSPREDVANLAAHPDVASVLIGRVVENWKEETVPLKNGGNLQSGRYGTWLVEVERYLVDPRPYPKVKLRFVEGFVHQNGSSVPPRIPVSLEQGQRAVFFLTRSVGTYDPPVENDVFTTPLGVGPDLPMGIRTIENDKVRNIVQGDIQEETLESFIKRINSAALKAGRAAPMSSPE